MREMCEHSVLETMLGTGMWEVGEQPGGTREQQGWKAQERGGDLVSSPPEPQEAVSIPLCHPPLLLVPAFGQTHWKPVNKWASCSQD
jgi:hypothetical protein